jgi:5-methylcytosine-specific restriction endonuclease McrA
MTSSIVQRTKHRKRSEFTLKTKLEAMARYLRCPGVFELGITCGKKLGSLKELQFDHVKRCEIEPDNSVENCRPLCVECHALKTKKKDVLEAKKGRHARRETKKSRRPKAKIYSAGFLPKEQRKQIKKRIEAQREEREEARS